MREYKVIYLVLNLKKQLVIYLMVYLSDKVQTKIYGTEMM